NLPTGELDRSLCVVRVESSDVDGDIAWVRVDIVRPDGESGAAEIQASQLGIPPEGGDVSVRLFPIDTNTPAGEWRISLTLYDEGGNRSETLETVYEFVESGGSPVLSIQSFDPLSGPGGTTITIEGSGFDATNPQANWVEIREVPAVVLAATATTLTVETDERVETGALVVRTDTGYAVGPEVFEVPARVVVIPDEASVSVGGTVNFESRTVSIGREVIWAVEGVEGGDATIGTIDANGNYVAPVRVPENPTVTVEAISANDASVIGTATVTIAPPTTRPGAGLIHHEVGGRVISENQRASIDIPADALASDETITLRALDLHELPLPLDGRRVLGAVAFGPDGLAFQSPVTIRLPLSRYLRPGSSVDVLLLDESTGEYVDQGFDAIVGENGDDAVTQVMHFSEYAVAEDSTAPSSLPPPTITEIETPYSAERELFEDVLDEGMKVPVHILGTHLTIDLIPSVVRDDGSLVDYVIPETFFGNGTEAGVVLDVRVNEALGRGQSDPMKLRLTRPNGDYGEVEISVLGADELHVPAGETLELTGEHRFSEVVIDGTLLVPDDDLIVRVHGDIEINGRIDASGAPGEDAPDGGYGEGSPDGGGRGGLGRDDAGCVEIPYLNISLGSFDCAEEVSFGQHGNECRGYGAGSPYQTFCADLTLTNGYPQGMGGFPGENLGFDFDLIAFSTNLVTCIAEEEDCFDVALTLTDLVLGNAFQFPAGQRGFPGVIHSFGPFTGGGGGAGGGRVSLGTHAIPIPVLDELGLDELTKFTVRLTGGGGGGGGGGGRGVDIRGSRSATISAGGSVATNGGKGGDGSTGGRLQLDILLGLVRFLDIPGVRSSPGGGGGG
ncbi:MAG: IPT/TIG domain-containing protein, partial [Planctomycetota bacterium]